MIQQASKLPEEIRNLIAGGLAGMVAKTVVAPVDRIKIMYQVTSVPFHLRDVPMVVYEIIQQEGFAALWRGNIATMLRVFPYAGIQFMVFDKCKSWIIQSNYEKKATTISPINNKCSNIKKSQHHLDPWESLMAGSMAGVVSVICTYPLDLTRAQLAMLKKKEGSIKQNFSYVIKSNYNRKGIAGLYRGMTPTLLGMFPYAGMSFTINEQGKRKIRKVYNREPTTVERMLIGGFAGLIGQSGTYPFEVTRRRMQTIGLVSQSIASSVMHAKTPTVNSRPSSMLVTIKNLYHEQGVKGFFKGLSMNWMKGPIAFSISFTSYDHFKSVLGVRVEDVGELELTDEEHNNMAEGKTAR